MSTYDKQFKEEAVRLAYEVGTRKAAQQLGISYHTLVDWRSRWKQYGERAYVGSDVRTQTPKKHKGKLNWNVKTQNCVVRMRYSRTLLVFSRRPKEVKTWRLFKYISLRCQRWNVEIMCRVLGVSESGYYRRLRTTDKPKRRERLLVGIKKIIGQYKDNDNYGARRIHLALIQEGEAVSYSTVYRIMKQNELIKKVKRHPNGITREDAAAQKSENLINRDFTAEAPNQKWLSDITEVPCSDGKLYVAAVMDCCGGEIVGLAMDDNMRKELCIQAFESARRAQNAYGMMFHSDRGSQFTSYAFRESLVKYGAVQSMSGTGRCSDNARMESFFATLKKEKLYRIRAERYPMSWVKTVIFRYVMVYYNRQRIYTSNPGGWPPIVHRERRKRQAA